MPSKLIFVIMLSASLLGCAHNKNQQVMVSPPDKVCTDPITDCPVVTGNGAAGKSTQATTPPDKYCSDPITNCPDVKSTKPTKQ